MKTILVTFILFHSVKLKTIKVFDTNKLMIYLKMGSDIGQTTSEMRKAPFAGLRVILYLRAGTDLAQPIRVVQDSCIKG
jgi:hypothetical protein